LKRLDRETQDLFRFHLVAYDGGSPPRSGSADLTIVVLDANDNSPVFDQTTYEVTIPEDVAPGTTVIRVRAEDLDIGQNGFIHYFLSPGTQAQHGHSFSVGNYSGDVIVVGEVDYETYPSYTLVVNAVDLGPNPVSSETVVVVRVEDVNDNPPSIVINTLSASRSTAAAVSEDAPVGTFLAHVVVSDPDSGHNGKSIRVQR